MSRYLGRGQPAICDRCGCKGYAKDLIKDGRNPGLLVLKTCGCYDPAHEAERPFIPKNQEGKARFPISPENLPPVEIVLTGSISGGELAWFMDAWAEDAWDEEAWAIGVGAILEWNRPTTEGARIEEYEVWRSVDEGPFELIDTNEFVYSDFMEVENDPEGHTDVDAADPGLYRYYIEAVTGNGRRHRSNTLELVSS